MTAPSALDPLISAIVDIMVREALEKPMRSYTADETARFDAAFDAGVSAAMKRGSGLLLIESVVGETLVWLAAFPLGELDIRQAANWAAMNGIRVSENDRYLPPSEVRRAAEDLDG